MSRHYVLRDAAKFDGEVVVELGSGTGIVGLALMKYTRVAKVVFSDHTDEIIDVIRQNIALQESHAESAVEFVDFNVPSTWSRLLNLERIDRLMATDVVY